MATPGRSSPHPLATTTTTLRPTKHPITYSFAQQMPSLPTRPRPPHQQQQHQHSTNPFPQLSNPSSNPPKSSWPHPSTSSHPQPNPKATAAEVVAGAAKQSDQSHDPPNLAAVDNRQQAELELYSKLVPTTSAVPRNPGRSLGGPGGLRATGSVATQKSRPVTPGAPTPASQPLPREPMTSRMKSLSSDASKPQLARRVARPSRTPSATPPPSASDAPNSDDSQNRTTLDAIKTDESRMELCKMSGTGDSLIAIPSPRQPRAATEDAYLRSIRSIYGNVERDTPRRSESTTASASKKSGVEGPNPSRSRVQPSRRLDEAFKSPPPQPSNRHEGRRSPSPVPSRKDQIGALRRSSAPSPPPGLHSAPRKGTGKDTAPAPVKNGKKASVQDMHAEAPPGFEARSSTVSRGAFLGRGRPENDASSGSKSAERERDSIPTRPQNSRAHAFREAINTRRYSNSPRNAASRRTSGVAASSALEPNGDVIKESPSVRAPSTRDTSRSRNGDKDVVRPLSFPGKHPVGENGTFSQENVRLRRKSDQAPISKREERIMSRRMESPTENPTSAAPSGESGPKVRDASPRKTNRTDSTTNGSIVERERNTRSSDDRLSSSVGQNRENVFAGTRRNGSTESPKVVQYCDRETDEEPMRLSTLEPDRINGWSDGTNGVSDGNAEAIVNLLLEDDDDDFMRLAPAPDARRPATTAASEAPSMIDLMRELHANGAKSSVLNSAERQEDVLPPLPDPEEYVRFEKMLRSMGWTPPEEDESPKNHESNGLALHLRQAAARGMSRDISDIGGMNSGLQSAENGEVRGSYYSHFQ